MRQWVRAFTKKGGGQGTPASRYRVSPFFWLADLLCINVERALNGPGDRLGYLTHKYLEDYNPIFSNQL